MRYLIGFLILFGITMSSCNNSEKKEPANENATEQVIASSSNNVVDCILSRRSIRAYKPEQIKDEELQTILNCGINAPSARNSQPWEIRVIQNKETIDELNKSVIADMIEKRPEAKERFADENASVFFHAPTLIVIAYDTTQYWGMSDCGMFAQNVLLAAESMNIGTCAVGCCREYLASEKATDFVKSLNLPENYEVYLTITVGYKDQDPEAKPRDEQKIQYVK